MAVHLSDTGCATVYEGAYILLIKRHRAMDMFQGVAASHLRELADEVRGRGEQSTGGGGRSELLVGHAIHELPEGAVYWARASGPH